MRNSLIVVVVLVSSALVMAQPTTQPGQPGAFGGRRGPRGGRGTPQEMAQVYEWSQQYMPNLAKMMQESRGRNGRGPGPLVNIALRNMRAVEQAPPNSPAQENFIKIAKAEDEIVPLLSELRNASAENRPAIREKIRKQMKQVVETALEDRAKRIKDLSERLDAEQKQLVADQSNADAIVNQRLVPFLNASMQMVPDEAPTTEPSNAMEPAGK